MCGIAGFWQPNQRRDESVLTKMLDQIDHRGPDGRGAFRENGLEMGHTRLSIIDLATGEQPLFEENLVFTGNGEFYDYKKTRCTLTAQGHTFRTKSDNEIALKFYQEYGLDFVQHLRGEFAFALFDQKKGRLILVRDRFGIRPLFYKVGPKGLFWGSEIKSILAHPDVEAKVSKRAAIHQMMQTMVPGMSLFEDVQALRPGHMLVIQPNGSSWDVQDHCYWDAEFPTLDDAQPDLKDEEVIANVRRLLIEAISLRLEADVPVACYLSGGIDSCSIFGLASALQQSPVTAFTIGFKDSDFDETEIAKAMTEQRRSHHKILSIGDDDLFGENYVNTVKHSERTFYNTLGVAKFLLSKLVHESNLKVVITGEGADELFGGYPFFKQDLMQLGKYEDLLGPQFDLYKSGGNKLVSGSMLTDDVIHHPSFDKLCGFTPNWLQTWIQTLKMAEPLFSPDLKKEMEHYDPIEGIASSLDQSKIEGRHPLNIAQYTWIKTTLEGQILNWGGDRVDMAHSLETRPAFLDHHLAEYAFSLPAHYLIRGGREKWVLREAVKGVLPEVLYNREKFPFMAPPAHFDEQKKTQLKKLCTTYLTKDRIEEFGILDPQKTTQFVEDYFSEKEAAKATRMDVVLNHVLGLHILKQFV